MVPPRPLYYTFGNHMHWVDMQWLWGYGVLPGSVRDMLHLCREAGVRGNVNFDGIGYEKMAAECPEALAELREAVAQGIIEPVGCSYGQPYGLFHGGESNIRQLTYGKRATRRLLGVRPRAFWEEEFYFFPQLPQLLAGCGYTGACLFFQWTWHTPEVPREPHALILWEGIDGSRIPALPRNDLNVHQWPEDFDGLLDSGLIKELDAPAVVQWLELMPTRDWMCRSELLLPRLKELMSDPRFEVRPRTVSQLISELAEPGRPAASGRPEPPVRAYTLDDVWHGMSLGKNADSHPRYSGLVESILCGTEALSALAGLFGRPYPSWDVYPSWELDESWRELLSAQHHDNHECEGLCGRIGEVSFARSETLAQGILDRTIHKLAARVDAPEGSLVAFNACGQPRSMYFTASEGLPPTVIRDVPAFGWAVVPLGQGKNKSERITVSHDRGVMTLSRGQFRIAIDRRRGLVTQISTPEFPQGLLHPDRPLGQLSMLIGGREDRFEHADVEVGDIGGEPVVRITRQGRDERQILMQVRLLPLHDALDITFATDDLPRPDPRMHAGLTLPIAPAFDIASIITDHPYAQSRVDPRGTFRRKYPTGDWMTSPQVFEDIHRPFTSLSRLDLVAADQRGLLITHDGSQQFFRDDAGVTNLLSMYDAWDEDRFDRELRARLMFFPHGPMSDIDRARTALSHTGNWSICGRGGPPGDLPARFGMLAVEDAPNILAHALFRESMKSGEHLPDWAGHRMFADSAGACDHPYVIRLVEWNGEPAEVVLKLPGPIAMAAKTNLLGEVAGPDARWLDIQHPVEPPTWAKDAKLRGEPIFWSALRFPMRPREIATIYADLLMGRKEWRDLDSKREVWAKIHKHA